MTLVKINKFFLLSLLLPAAAFSGSLPENKFCVKYGTIQLGQQTPSNVETVVNPSTYTYSITSGKTWGGLINSKNGCIIVKADQSNNSSNVAWVKNQLATFGPLGENGEPIGVKLSGNTAFTGRGYDDTPSKLNFAIKALAIITLNSLEYKCPNFMLGQGYTSVKGIYYNWWGFQNYYTTTGKHTIQCFDYKNNPVIFNAKINGSYSLELSQIAG